MRGETYRPGQANNAYVFPGAGRGLITRLARCIGNDMFLAAARRLAAMTTGDDLANGSVYPPLASIRKVSLAIAVAVAEQAWEERLAQAEHPGVPRP